MIFEPAKLRLHLKLVKEISAHQFALNDLRISVNRCIHPTDVLEREKVLQASIVVAQLLECWI